MKITPPVTSLLCLSGALIISAASAFGATASTTPLGYVTYDCPGNSDTRIGAPFHRKAEFVGKVDTVAGTVAAPIITVEGSPGWTAGAFVPTTAAGQAPDRDVYFLLISSGDGGVPENTDFVGRWYEVTANGTDTITLDTGGEDISTAVVSGTQVQLIPFWTLDSLFPSGQGVHPTPTFANFNSEILIPDTMTAGVNLSNSETYFYYSGAAAGGAGWRKAGSSPLGVWGNQPLSPDLQVIIRHNISTATTVVPMGHVFTAPYKTPVSRLASNVGQDNAVFLTVPIDVNLGDSQLYDPVSMTGAVEPNMTFLAANGDQVLVFDATEVNQNKSNAETYFYYGGAAAGGPGWRKVGDSPLIKHDGTDVFTLDKQVVVRKAAPGAAATVIWGMTPGYLPNF